MLRSFQSLCCKGARLFVTEAAKPAAAAAAQATQDRLQKEEKLLHDRCVAQHHNIGYVTQQTKDELFVVRQKIEKLNG